MKFKLTSLPQLKNVDLYKRMHPKPQPSQPSQPSQHIKATQQRTTQPPDPSRGGSILLPLDKKIPHPLVPNSRTLYI